MTALRWEDFWQEGVWTFPKSMNIAEQVCDVWAAAQPDRVALISLGAIDTDAASQATNLTYGQLRAMADRLARSLSDVERGDRVGVLLSQEPWCAAAHIAIWKLGAISVPLFKLFGESALRTRIEDAGIRIVLCDAEGAARLSGLSDVVPVNPDHAIHEKPGPLRALSTSPEDPAVLIYTSGTTGKPKGALLSHRVLVGHLPGVIASHSGLGKPGDCLWTPADWAWIGGLFDVLMPGLALGVPVVAARMQKFSVGGAQEICRKAKVRNVFLPPTALRVLKAADARIAGLRSVASGGEPLGAEMLAWGKGAFDVTINEFYGQTECNMVVSADAAAFDTPAGTIGKPASGFDVAVIDETGQRTSVEGDIAVRRGAPSMMLGYWQNAQATAEKFRGDWMLTGDRGVLKDGFVRFLGREDDVINSAGYRIGPGEIEDCLLTHPDVATVGVVGKPDALRTEIVKAYAVLKPGARGDVAALQEHVKRHLAAHCYPREIAFVDALPMTVTGKVIRKELRAQAAAEVAP